jgi:hypothetical protein
MVLEEHYREVSIRSPLLGCDRPTRNFTAVIVHALDWVSSDPDASTEDYFTFQNLSPNLDRFLTKDCGRLPTFWKRFHQPGVLLLPCVDVSRPISDGPPVGT